MKSENHTINLPIGELSNLNQRGLVGKLYIGDSVREALLNTTKSLVDLSEEIDISENTIRRWSNGAFKTIRRNNLNALAKALNKTISFDKNTVELVDEVNIVTTNQNLIDTDDIGIELKETHLKIQTEDLLNSLQDTLKQKDKHINLLEQIVDEKTTTITDQISQIRVLDETIKNLSAKNINMNLDHNRMQFIVNMEKASYVSVTQHYADLFKKDAFDIVNNCSWEDLVHKDDLWRFAVIIGVETDEMRLNPQTWKVKGSNGNSKYVETVTTPLDDKGVFKKVDAKIATQEMWETSNKYYKSFPSIRE